jgi:hypothetical protein
VVAELPKENHQDDEVSPSLSTKTATEEPRITNASRCYPSVDYDSIQLRKEIEQLQYPANCATAKVALWPWFTNGNGWGSQFLLMYEAYTVAFRLNRLFVPIGEFDYALNANPEACGNLGHSLDCLFEPFTNCSMDDLLHGETPVMYDWTKPNEYWDNIRIIQFPPNNNQIPLLKPYWKTRGRVWFTGQLFKVIILFVELAICINCHTADCIKFFMRPNKFITNEIIQDKKTLNWDSYDRILAVHVRHGDKYAEAKVQPFSACIFTTLNGALLTDLPSIISIHCKHNISGIFLSTDDPGVPEETKNYPQFKWLWSPNELRLNAQVASQIVSILANCYGHFTYFAETWLCQWLGTR